MQAMRAGLDDEFSGAVRDLAADLQTSIALSRVLVRTLACLSPACGVAAATALEDEAELARRRQADVRMLDALQRLQAAVSVAQEEEASAQRLEKALIAAASGLGDEPGPHAA
jgi:hypothetical protein